MRTLRAQSGFTAVELLITLFVAAAFLIAAYQLFNVVIRDGGQARAESRAGNIAYDYLRQYTSQAYNPCVAYNPLVNSPITVSGITNARLSVSITCPEYTVDSVSKVEVSITYNTPTQTVKYATYTPGVTSEDSSLLNGLIAWWKLNGDANSSVGSAHGTIVGAVPTTGQSGAANGAYSFDGTNDYINAQLSNVGGDMVHSITLWYRPDTLTINGNGRDPFSMGNASGSQYSALEFNPTNIYWYSYNNDIYRTPTPVVGSWVFIALTYAGGGATTTNKRVYINSTIATMSTQGAEYGFVLNLPANSPVGIGYDRGRNTSFFDGTIDDIRVYDRVLSQTEINALYSQGAQ